MNTTIMVGYNNKSFGKKMRLMNMFQSVANECESDSIGLQKKVAGLSDSEGELSIVWAELPSHRELNAFSQAWSNLGEKEECVTHVWLGLPDKPLKQSVKADHKTLNALCKKIADAYLHEYLLESGKSSGKAEKTAVFEGKDVDNKYEPEWNPKAESIENSA